MQHAKSIRNVTFWQVSDILVHTEKTHPVLLGKPILKTPPIEPTPNLSPILVSPD